MNAPEREHLEALMAARGDDAIAIDELHGLCAALVIGPPLEDDVDWRDVVQDGGRSSELDELLASFFASVKQHAEARTLTIEPRALRTGRSDYTGWCRGFLDGVDIADWFDYADAEELDELLFPIEVVADALAEVDRAAYKPAQWRRLVHDSMQGLPEAVGRLMDYWRIVLAPPATIRRDQPKVGRNDPCPCGSGRKFKQCHGRG